MDQFYVHSKSSEGEDGDQRTSNQSLQSPTTTLLPIIHASALPSSNSFFLPSSHFSQQSQLFIPTSQRPGIHTTSLPSASPSTTLTIPPTTATKRRVHQAISNQPQPRRPVDHREAVVQVIKSGSYISKAILAVTFMAISYFDSGFVHRYIIQPVLNCGDLPPASLERSLCLICHQLVSSSNINLSTHLIQHINYYCQHYDDLDDSQPCISCQAYHPQVSMPEDPQLTKKHNKDVKSFIASECDENNDIERRWYHENLFDPPTPISTLLTLRTNLSIRFNSTLLQQIATDGTSLFHSKMMLTAAPFLPPTNSSTISSQTLLFAFAPVSTFSEETRQYNRFISRSDWINLHNTFYCLICNHIVSDRIDSQKHHLKSHFGYYSELYGPSCTDCRVEFDPHHLSTSMYHTHVFSKQIRSFERQALAARLRDKNAFHRTHLFESIVLHLNQTYAAALLNPFSLSPLNIPPNPPTFRNENEINEFDFIRPSAALLNVNATQSKRFCKEESVSESELADDYKPTSRARRTVLQTKTITTRSHTQVHSKPRHTEEQSGDDQFIQIHASNKTPPLRQTLSLDKQQAFFHNNLSETLLSLPFPPPFLQFPSSSFISNINDPNHNGLQNWWTQTLVNNQIYLSELANTKQFLFSVERQLYPRLLEQYKFIAQQLPSPSSPSSSPSSSLPSSSLVSWSNPLDAEIIKSLDAIELVLSQYLPQNFQCHVKTFVAPKSVLSFHDIGPKYIAQPSLSSQQKIESFETMAAHAESEIKSMHTLIRLAVNRLRNQVYRLSNNPLLTNPAIPILPRNGDQIDGFCSSFKLTYPTTEAGILAFTGDRRTCPFVECSWEEHLPLPTNLFIHIATHTNENPYQCPYCSTSSKHQGFIDWHIPLCRTVFANRALND